MPGYILPHRKNNEPFWTSILPQVLEPRRRQCPESKANLTTTTLPNQPEFESEEAIDKDKLGKASEKGEVQTGGGLEKAGGKVYLVLPRAGTEEKGRLLWVNSDDDSKVAQKPKSLFSAKSLHLTVCNLTDNLVSVEQVSHSFATNISYLSSTPKLGRFGYMKKVESGGISFLPSSTH